MRYLPLTDADRRAMLATIGVASIDALFRDVPRSGAARRARSTCRAHAGELEVERALGAHGGEEPRRRRRCRSFSAPAPIGTMCRPRSIT